MKRDLHWLNKHTITITYHHLHINISDQTPIHNAFKRDIDLEYEALLIMSQSQMHSKINVK